ncbi:MAG: glutamate-1-semialdehyde 2,1-aminomutase [Endozoicomonadaceae bacterium]|nr:glutamate-1-semialdehyde 2,1-aminomutase [Endozoicomonadaceae bacterium]
MTTQQALFTEALQYIPGGVNSPVRAFSSVGGTPIFFKRAQGAHLFDTNNQQYIDYVGSWGPMIMGHNHPKIQKKLTEQIILGLSFGSPTALETKMAKKITQMIPSIQQVRMVNSGTEAVMSAIRLARAYTKRHKIIKFSGCYHGHVDTLLVQAGSGALTCGIPDSAGIPEAVTQDTLVLPYNDISALKSIFTQYATEIAAVIIEPIAGNMNCVIPDIQFLQALRDYCTQYDALLLFDEVMTGFRVHSGGAQARYQIMPDLTILGKIIGGGMPVGAFGGRQEIMSYLAPLGPVYQAGTLSGNPMAMAAGLQNLILIQETKNLYDELEARCQHLLQGLQEHAHAHHIPFSFNYAGGLFGFFFSDQTPKTSHTLTTDQKNYFKLFFHGMLKKGIYFAPSPYEAGFMSFAHTTDLINETIQASQSVFETMTTYHTSSI